MLLGSILLILLIEFNAARPTNTCNITTEFNCGIGKQQCIPVEWVCDNVPDCENGNDESHCVYPHHCAQGFMMCKTGMCVSQEFKCDKEVDCTDASDELHCEYRDSKKETDELYHFSLAPLQTQECHLPRFSCNSGQCISGDLVCDGTKDCNGGDDEENCRGPESRNNKWLKNNNTIDGTPDKLIAEHCRPGYTMCATGGVCIPDSFVCDGSADCEDSSDEMECQMMIPDEEQFINGHAEIIARCTAEGKFHCSTEFNTAPVCIPVNATCNGIKDCPNGDDETALCTECSRKRCDHTCLNSPFGAKCICQEGYRLEGDGLTCTDEDECLTHGNKCQHFCEDKIGTYSCQCAVGYRLDEDGHSCRLDDKHADGVLFISLGTEIRKMSLLGTTSEAYASVQRIGGHGTSRSIDFMHSNNKLFLSAVTHHKGKAPEGELAVSDNGLLRVLRENVVGVGHVAVDWVGGNIFFTQRAPALTIGISVCTMNGMFCRWLIKGQSSPSEDPFAPKAHQNYHGLVVHPARGQIIWVDSFKDIHRIMSSRMDGTEIRIIVDKKLSSPHGLAIDRIRNDIYFGDHQMHHIERINLDTKERHIVVSNEVNKPFGIAYFNGYIYWSDWGTDSLKVLELNNHQSTPHTLHVFSRFPYGVTINHTMYQPIPLDNPCLEMECPWICVPIPADQGKVAGKCVCPDGYKYSIVEDSCIPPTEEEKKEIEGYTHIGAALMKEYCDAGMACLNGGSCKDVHNEHGRPHQVSCECQDPFEGEFCERLNPEKMRMMEEKIPASLIGFLIVLILAFLAIGAFAFCLLRKPEVANEVVTNARIKVDNMTRKAEAVSQPYIDRLKALIGQPSPQREGIRSAGNVNFMNEGEDVDEPTNRYVEARRAAQLESPNSYRNPLFDEPPQTYQPVGRSSPIAGVLNFQNDSLL
ncbi:unnamed protein product [Caenorhabditis bovis]|uniref:EGF-like domain-containing protein n=1 Tax=Caenorhabditis bovis TaxID=2654633 RepID=A0A8S1F495_9PELO|nr:unnamed protein product [Caenorhabditis bovis]